MKQKKTAPRPRLRAALIVLCVVLGLALTVILGVTIYTEHLLNQMNYVDPDSQQATLSQEEINSIENATDPLDPDADFTGPSIDEDDVDWGGEVEIDIGGENNQNIINILLIGKDVQIGTDRPRSDTMILCTFNRQKKTLTMTSFLRDLYLQIPGYQDNRINVAYNLGGMTLLNKTLKHNFGIHVDGTVEVDFAQFSKIIDLLGGVERELTAEEAKYINKWVEGSELEEGSHLLSGEQALMYARNRQDADGDFSRTNRQRKLLTEVVDTYRESSVTTMISLMNEILPMVTTDMNKSDIMSYVKNLWPLVEDCQIITQRIPVDGGFYYAMVRDMSVLVPNMTINRQALIDSITDTDSEGVG